jgi:predicted kinase
VRSDGVDRHYLIVFGPAASGKTLVARGLSDELGWPIFAKDTIKAALMSVLLVADVDDARRLGRAAVEVLLAVAVEVTGGAVLEAVWRRDQGRDEVSSLPGAVQECSVDVIGRRWRRGTQRDADLPGRIVALLGRGGPP